MAERAQLRGARLREHIVLSAKEEFLESGYEGTSMDAVAARAQTSKRSLYAHFPSKDDLFLAVLDLVQGLYLDKLRTPEEYSGDPLDAVTLFCARFLQLMTWEPVVRTTRLSVAEAARRPEHSRAYFEAMVASSSRRLASYLSTAAGLSEESATGAAVRLVEETVLPHVLRTLMSVEPAAATLSARPRADPALRDRVREVLAGPRDSSGKQHG